MSMPRNLEKRCRNFYHLKQLLHLYHAKPTSEARGRRDGIKQVPPRHQLHHQVEVLRGVEVLVETDYVGVPHHVQDGDLAKRHIFIKGTIFWIC